MSNRTANYSAFYVKEPFDPSNLGANATPDFRYYRMLQAWKGKYNSFYFVDAHGKTYNVRDGSKWPTLQNRLHERLSVSKNIVLFLSFNTKRSQALTEEMEYGILTKGLPVIVVYPELDCYNYFTLFKEQISSLWDRLPAFRNNMDQVATLHIPFKLEFVQQALNDDRFAVRTMAEPGRYYYKSPALKLTSF